MKGVVCKLICCLVLILVSGIALGQVAVDTLDVSHLADISKSSKETAMHTRFDFWDGFSVFLSVAALLFSIFTFFSQKGTEGNTKKLSLDAQHNLLRDLIRHLYRNQVITYTIKTKMHDCDYQGYPSEEHLVKLKIPMSNIHLDAFYGNDKHYEAMHKLYLNLRNYNNEIDVIVTHMSNMNISKDDLKRDMGTLLFKPGFLISCIIDVIGLIWKTDALKEAAEQILRAQNQRNDCDNILIDSEFEPYTVSGSHIFHSIFKDSMRFDAFMAKFNSDVLIERGKNNQGEDKVYIIKTTRGN